MKLYYSPGACSLAAHIALQEADRFRCQEWLNFIATELHKTFAPAFHMKQMHSKSECQVEMKSYMEQKLCSRFDYLSKALQENEFLLGEDYSVADIYFFTISRWLAKTSLNLDRWSALQDHHDRVLGRPAVQKTLKAEGLL